MNIIPSSAFSVSEDTWFDRDLLFPQKLESEMYLVKSTANKQAGYVLDLYVITSMSYLRIRI